MKQLHQPFIYQRIWRTLLYGLILFLVTSNHIWCFANLTLAITTFPRNLCQAFGDA